MFAGGAAAGLRIAGPEPEDGRHACRLWRLRPIIGADLGAADPGGRRPAQAQLNPSRQITIVVPIGAGGGVDATGRLIAEKLQERLKQPVVVENRPAGGGMVGANSVAKAAPDGHTLLLMETLRGAAQVAAQQRALRRGRRFRADRPRRHLAVDAVRRPSFAPNDMRELIALAKAQPGKLSAGTPGVGTPHHLGLMMLNALAKVEIVNVPYRGAALSLNDLLAGPNSDDLGRAHRGDAACCGRQGQDSRRRVGAAAAVAAAGAHRSARAACRASTIEIFFGVAAPAKTPPDLVARLAGELAEISSCPMCRSGSRAPD